MEDKMKILLEKYYAGQTSLEEEKAIKDYFSQSNDKSVDSTDKQYFNALDNNDDFIPDDLESSILEAIQISPEPVKIKKRHAIKVISSWAVAASLVLATGFGWYFTQTHYNQKIADTYSDPTIAYQETVRVLAFIGSKINKAQQRMEPISKISRVSNSLQPIGLISKSLQRVENIKLLESPLSKTSNAENSKTIK